jgi:peroxiredoxin Q/BCP
MRITCTAVALLALSSLAPAADAAELEAGQPAPRFTAKTQDGTDFDLASRTGKWTVLYFYPKAGTPGCTKEASAFRDNIALIRDQGADVLGISTDTVESQAAFHKEQQLVFTLLADPDGAVTEQYGAKMPILTMAKRWTFIIDPTLTIRLVERDVDPAMDAQRVASEIARLKDTSATPAAAAQRATPAS